ncbi:Ssu72-like protein [Trichuris suis]|uniref:RNA polymerase II subunit A C-terminal domain phosphatase SSU72 n=1 Tax=Trichuris suis TaxID=68888 RepID=A0A085LJY3_9BILA|nr:hypothetical protein M513_13844 [Trichuris suis]KHJ44211.1 Ssu72-like protein [Trichuris suis]
MTSQHTSSIGNGLSNFSVGSILSRRYRGNVRTASGKLRFAVVCSSNMNRSMEAHSILSKKGFTVSSFGTGTKVKLPGPAANMPNMYSFSTTYAAIYNDLAGKDFNLYTQNGLLNMLERNKQIKPRPERFQECTETFDVVICCEERVFNQAMEYMISREIKSEHICHIINIDIQDNHEEATLGAFMMCDICRQLEMCRNLNDDIEDVLSTFEEKSKREILHVPFFY